MQVFEVNNRKLGILICARRIAPVDVYRLAGLDPGIAVVGVYQIQILDLIDIGISAECCCDSRFECVGTFRRSFILDDAVKQQGRLCPCKQYIGIVQGVGRALRRNSHSCSGINLVRRSVDCNIAGSVATVRYRANGEIASSGGNIVGRFASACGNDVIFIGENGNGVGIINLFRCCNSITFDHLVIVAEKLDANRRSRVLRIDQSVIGRFIRICSCLLHCPAVVGGVVGKGQPLGSIRAAFWHSDLKERFRETAADDFFDFFPILVNDTFIASAAFIDGHVGRFNYDRPTLNNRSGDCIII